MLTILYSYALLILLVDFSTGKSYLLLSTCMFVILSRILALGLSTLVKSPDRLNVVLKLAFYSRLCLVNHTVIRRDNSILLV